MSDHLNQQFNQLNNQTNNQNSQLNNQSFSKNQLLNGQLTKNALLVPSNSILNNQTKQSRQTRSTENIKYRSNSSINNQQQSKNLDQIVDEFKNYEKQRKHHSDNDVIKDFIQINKNLNELSMNKSVGVNLDANKDINLNKNVDRNVDRNLDANEVTNVDISSNDSSLKSISNNSTQLMNQII